MKYDLTIKNFQSIKHAELEIFGLTVLWGAHSSIGKSAVVRALDSMLFGNAPKGIVRNGEKAALVMLEWEDHVIKWAKGDNINGYVIDGVKFDKVGRTVPAEIANLGFYPLDMQDMIVKPQVRKQFDKAWPLLLSAPDLGKVVGSLVRTEKVYTAIKSLLADSAKIRSKRGKVETLLASKQAEMKEFDGVDRVKAAIGRINYTEAKEAKARLEEADRLDEAKRLAEDKLKMASCAFTTELPDPIAIAKLVHISDTLSNVAGLEFKMTSCAVLRADLPDPVHIKLLADVERCLQSMEVKQLLYEETVASLDVFTADLEKQGISVCDDCDGTGFARGKTV